MEMNTPSQDKRPSIFVRAKLTDSALEKLEKVAIIKLKPNADKEEIIREISDCDGIICHGPERFYTEDFFNSASNLKVLARTSVGTDMIDLESATRHDVVVSNAAGTNAISVAEEGLLLMLAASRKLIKCDRLVRDREPFRQTHIYNALQGQEIYGKNVGIIGFGAVGRELAARTLALGVNTFSYDPIVDPDTMKSAGVIPADLEDLLKTSDFVVLCCPLTTATKDMINRKNLSLMKPEAYLINIARAGLIVIDDLVETLKAKGIAGVALDVTDPEPPLENDPLIQMDNVFFSAHQGGNTKDCWQRMCHTAVDNALSVLVDRKRPKNLVNQDVYKGQE